MHIDSHLQYLHTPVCRCDMHLLSYSCPSGMSSFARWTPRVKGKFVHTHLSLCLCMLTRLCGSAGNYCAYLCLLWHLQDSQLSQHTRRVHIFSAHMSRIDIQFMKVVPYKSGNVFAEPYTQSPSHSLTSWNILLLQSPSHHTWGEGCSPFGGVQL